MDFSSYTRHRQPHSQSEHVVPNVTIMEDAKFLETMLRLSYRSINVINKWYQGPNEGSRRLLYDESMGCTKEFTMLRSMLKLLVLKARYSISDADFHVFLCIIVDMLRENQFPLTCTMQRS